MAPWARALIVALALVFIAGVFAVAGATSMAALFGWAGLAVAIVGGIMALSTVKSRGA